MIYTYTITGTLETKDLDETIDLVQLILEDVVRSCKIELNGKNMDVVTK